jgi:hypothetical protein
MGKKLIIAAKIATLNVITVYLQSVARPPIPLPSEGGVYLSHLRRNAPGELI